MRFPATIAIAAVLAALPGCRDAVEPVEDQTAVVPSFTTQLRVPEDHPGNPFYALIFNGLQPDSPGFFFPHSEEWGAAIFEREPSCVPSDFNLLNEFDFQPAFPGGPPRVFLCSLTVAGFQLWHNPPNPLAVDPGPILVYHQGLGAVPVLFAHWEEIENAMADQVLTLPELLALPSAVMATADQFTTEYVNGPFDQTLMNKLEARGVFSDGRGFRIHANESQAGTVYQVVVGN